jgi:NADH-quinone oxidoreductase subunit E
MNASTCQRTCWLVAAASGVALALLVRSSADAGLVRAVLAGLAAALVLGFLLSAFACGARRRGGLPAEPYQPREAPTPGPRQAAAELPVSQPMAGVAAPPDPPLPPPAAPAEPEAAARAPAVAEPKAERTRKTAGRKAQPRAAGIDAAMNRTHEATPAEAAPTLLLAPRDGKADDLKRIVGVGPVLERLLNEVGVWHFDQIAGWKARDIAFVDAKLKTFKGRITRDEWVKQARLLARDAAKAR